MDSILDTIKNKLGIESTYTDFDDTIITDINTVFMTLEQLGVGPNGGFSISGSTETWSDYLGVVTNLEGIKTYIYLKVRLSFDPPANAFLVEAINRQTDELAWRIITQVEDTPIAEGGV